MIILLKIFLKVIMIYFKCFIIFSLLLFILYSLFSYIYTLIRQSKDSVFLKNVETNFLKVIIKKISNIKVNKKCPDGLSNTRSDTYLNCNRSVCIDYLKVRFNRLNDILNFKVIMTLTLVKVKQVF